MNIINQKRNGTPILLKEKNKEDKENVQKINRFLNGLNLLLDFEVARRIADHRDVYSDLPVVSCIAYLLENFEKPAVMKDCFDKLFSGEARKNFIKEDIIDNQKNIKNKRQIRRKLEIFHQEGEDSDDDYN